uniref:FYVE-type domain-containing protein n=1 Tax=Acrobeloides nanus TaxID=290746 RepID=A0A914BUS3_9BILA
MATADETTVSLENSAVDGEVSNENQHEISTSSEIQPSKSNENLNSSNTSSDLEKDLNNAPSNAQLDKTLTCEMCINYEANLAKLQQTERELREQLAAKEQLVDRYENELSGERVYRTELENNMRTLSAENEKMVKETIAMNQEFVEQLNEFEKLREATLAGMKNELKKSSDKYLLLEADMITLSHKYQKLLGLNRQKAEEMRDQIIDFPQSVEELQILCLQLREELIEARSAKEHSVAELKDELTLMQEQLKEEQIDRKRVEEQISKEYSKVTADLDFARNQLEGLHLESQRVEERNRQMEAYKKLISESEAKVANMQKERVELEKVIAEYRQKCTTQQKELDNIESVQKDFVVLSQGLQIQLEKIRQAEQEVRWQFDEDVSNCNQCEIAFSPKRPKLHCLHCGKIFCHNCLKQTIPSGPHRKPAKVCEVCHTLLNRDSAPYFSKQSGISNNNS